MKKRDEHFLQRKFKDIKKVADDVKLSQQQYGFLGRVTGATAIGPANYYRWLYTVEPIFISATSPYNPLPKVTAPATPITYEALSISELGNENQVYSYGVPEADLIGTFVPVRIPNNTPVYCVPARRDDGTFFWLIINTQAITGQCEDVFFQPLPE